MIAVACRQQCRVFSIELPLSKDGAAHLLQRVHADKSPICAVFSRAALNWGEVGRPWIAIEGVNPEKEHVVRESRGGGGGAEVGRELSKRSSRQGQNARRGGNYSASGSNKAERARK